MDKAQQYAHRLTQLAATLWVGGMWAVGYLAVPVLFHGLADNRQLAGMLAGHMFSAIAYIGMASAGLILLCLAGSSGRRALQLAAFWLAGIMLLLVLVGQFWIQPVMTDLKAQALPAEVMHSAFADRFKLLHGISSIIYLAQSLLGAALILKIRRC